MARATARKATRLEIEPWREVYRRSMACQIVHDSLHDRGGWTVSYVLSVDGEPAGYGSVAVGGPWKGTPTVFELWVSPRWRPSIFDLFQALRDAGGANAITTQTNDPLLSVVAHTLGEGITVEKILFQDQNVTTHTAGDLVFRPTTPMDRRTMFAHTLEPVGEWVIEADRRPVATGGVLYHYNPPYGDLYFEVAQDWRGRGVGTYLVQELKRVCREGGHVPAARCGLGNLASRRTLLRAGFSPCGHVITATCGAASVGVQ